TGLVQRQCDRAEALTTRTAAEDIAHDRRLRLIDHPPHPAGIHPQIVVPEHPTARDMAGAGFPLHRVVRALPGLLALELVCERREREHDLVGRRIERALAILEIEEHAHASGDELL